MLACPGVLALVLGPWPAGAAGLPPDVAVFMARRDRCDHFHGEDAKDAARLAAIAWALTANSRGTDAELALLLRSHAGNAAIRDLLNDYDSDVEGLSSHRH